MTPSQIRDLINEVADRFWPAKRLAPLGSILDDIGFLNVLLFAFDKTDDSSGDRDTMEMVQAVLPKDVELGVLILEYSYASGVLELYTELKPAVELSYGDMTRIVDAVLDSFTEARVRARFAEFEPKFFEFTKSTPADWHMS
jgi:hypothetical protein